MFSTEDRCVYANNPLADVICQLRFPEILSIETNLPANFQEAIRAEFPRYSSRKEQPAPKLAGNPGAMHFEKPPMITNHQFTSADGIWRINLTSKFISLACTRYTCWEDFAAKLDQPLASFIQLYKPAFFDRVGLRYVNFISRKALCVEDVPFSELISPCYLGPLAEADVIERNVSRNNIEVEMNIRGGCKVKLHAGPGLVRRNGTSDNEVKFIFDLDLFMGGQVPVNLSAGALQTLHSQAYPIFRGAISDLLHRAMDPVR